ncbi:cysteine dioxygenase [Ammoniphilus resinae]|uniref:Cysteine dioxygenase n=1 Tax=Ammoniphilus resinae TaxID=861532 RepID=A0ABS4GWL0_9BACL|nr:cysteine dioxygenase family protein [Ammoniphilus resinae]MBP1934417.1 cysteine dioxygenase [Ammoniphilus resinae]
MNLIQRLHSCFDGITTATLEDLRNLLEKLNLTMDIVQDHITEPQHLPYGRHVVYSNEYIEVIVLNIPPGRRTALHDHGESIGCAYVVEGELLNRNYKLDEKGTPVKSSEQHLKSGDYYVAFKGQLHIMENKGNARFIGLHAYTPPLTNMSVYEDPASW